MSKIEHLLLTPETVETISKGAFLTVKAGDKLNTMTIGWVTSGYIWRKNVLMVAVRPVRYTFELMEKATDFTVSVPSTDMSKELELCGTRSGREMDKFKECGLKLADAKKVSSPIIDTPGLHYECKIFYSNAMDPKRLDAKVDAELYPQKDHHMLYFGEVLAAYEIG